MDTLLISKIRTVKERDTILGGIEAMEMDKNALKTKIPDWASEIIRKEMTSDTYIKDIKKLLVALKPLKLVIAFDPTESTIDKLCTYLKGEYILDLEYDPKIIGGAIIISKGIYRDYSLKKTIWTTLENI